MSEHDDHDKHEPYAPPPEGRPGQPPAWSGSGESAYGGLQPATPDGLYLDQVSGLLLPVGTGLASAGRRIGAWFLSIVLVIVTLGIGYLVWGLVVWGRGQTPALQVLGMRCWRPETRRTAGFGWMALREIVGRFVDGVLGIVTGLVSFILMLATQQRRSLHDYIAGTVVLHDPNKILG